MDVLGFVDIFLIFGGWELANFLRPGNRFFGVGEHFSRPYDANFLRPKNHLLGWGTTFRDPTMLIV